MMSHQQQTIPTQTSSTNEDTSKKSHPPKNNSRLLLSELPTPSFVINKYSLIQNCQQILDSAKDRNLKIRPHIKTHKTFQGCWIQAYGDCTFGTSKDTNNNVTGFVTSTLPEIQMLVNAATTLTTTTTAVSPSNGTTIQQSQQTTNPFCDILYGVPISASKLPMIDKLRQQLQKSCDVDGQEQDGTTSKSSCIHILVDHMEQITAVEEYLNKKSQSPQQPFSVFIKLDTGYHRAGVPATSPKAIQLAMRIHESPFVNLVGVYSHCGHSYNINEQDKLHDIVTTDMEQIHTFLTSFRSELQKKTQPSSPSIVDDLIVSVGSTPSVFHHEHLNTPSSNKEIPNLEIHPGNYTLYDRQQLWTGACKNESQIAGRVIARVIGHYEDRNTILLDAGALALTKETTPQGGMCSIMNGTTGTVYPNVVCLKVSQEVTIVQMAGSSTLCTFPFQDFPLGSIVNLLPNHSCLSAACFDKYYIIDDPTCTFAPNQEIIDEWIPAKGFTIN